MVKPMSPIPSPTIQVRPLGLVEQERQASKDRGAHEAGGHGLDPAQRESPRGDDFLAPGNEALKSPSTTT